MMFIRVLRFLLCYTGLPTETLYQGAPYPALLYPSINGATFAYVIAFPDNKNIYSQCITNSTVKVEDCAPWQTITKSGWINDTKISIGACESLCLKGNEYYNLDGEYTWHHYNEAIGGPVYQCADCIGVDPYLYPWKHDDGRKDWLLGADYNAYNVWSVCVTDLGKNDSFRIYYDCREKNWRTFYNGTWHLDDVTIYPTTAGCETWAHTDTDTSTPTPT
eukprot:928776_1